MRVVRAMSIQIDGRPEHPEFLALLRRREPVQPRPEPQPVTPIPAAGTQRVANPHARAGCRPFLPKHLNDLLLTLHINIRANDLRRPVRPSPNRLPVAFTCRVSESCPWVGHYTGMLGKVFGVIAGAIVGAIWTLPHPGEVIIPGALIGFALGGIRQAAARTGYC